MREPFADVMPKATASKIQRHRTILGFDLPLCGAPDGIRWKRQGISTLLRRYDLAWL
jgi:hypothetical protein